VSALDALRLRRRRLFAEAYVANRCNATAAAIAAGYSKQRAQYTGAELLRVPEVQAAIDELLAAQEERLKVTADEVHGLARDIARADPRQMFNAEGLLLRPHQWPDEFARAVQAVTMKKVRDLETGAVVDTVAVQLAPRHEALRLLAVTTGLVGPGGAPKPPPVGDVIGDARQKAFELLARIAPVPPRAPVGLLGPSPHDACRVGGGYNLVEGRCDRCGLQVVA
jgi:phage terminase small subunit